MTSDLESQQVLCDLDHRSFPGLMGRSQKLPRVHSRDNGSQETGNRLDNSILLIWSRGQKYSKDHFLYKGGILISF